ncbi:mitochondrial inner membrane protease subunit 2 isoform X2 [Labeo rohita]|uniref:Mitochondrial inner membrane protease subunit 2 isoform X2 n=1 Tax=Labeo rohita TaxID=84645 RepID=A0A498MGV8_LABRO|nr:mitochondrial inner membrane protease subunit 2 isoform X2 [Labeo rohita]
MYRVIFLSSGLFVLSNDKRSPYFMNWRTAEAGMVEMSPLENASEVIENKTLIAQCQMRQMLNIKPLTMCLNGVIDAAVNGGLARYQEAMAQTGFGRRYFKAFVSGFFVAVPVTVTVLDRLAYVARVEGASMQPSLNPAGETSPDVVLLNRWSVRNYQVQRGDIVSVLPEKLDFVA